MSSSRNIEHVVWGTVFCEGCKERQDEIDRLRAALEEVLKWRGVLTEENQRLRSALREIAACPQKRHRADGDVDVYYNGATMLKIAREALGDE